MIDLEYVHKLRADLDLTREELARVKAKLETVQDLLAEAANHLEFSLDYLKDEDEEAAEEEAEFIADCRAAAEEEV